MEFGEYSGELAGLGRDHRVLIPEYQIDADCFIEEMKTVLPPKKTMHSTKNA